MSLEKPWISGRWLFPDSCCSPRVSPVGRGRKGFRGGCGRARGISGKQGRSNPRQDGVVACQDWDPPVPSIVFNSVLLHGLYLWTIGELVAVSMVYSSWYSSLKYFRKYPFRIRIFPCNILIQWWHSGNLTLLYYRLMSSLYANSFNCLNNALHSFPILLTIQSSITFLLPFNLE